MPPTKAQIGFGTLLAYGGGPQPVPTASGYLVNGALTEGATTIVVDTGTGTIPAGAKVTFGSDTTVYVVATALASGSFTLTDGLAAAVADDAAVAVTQGDEVFTQVAEVMGDISVNQSMDEVEVTHHGSPDRSREYVPTLINRDASFSVNFLPGDVGQQALADGIFTVGAVRNWRVTYPVTPAVTHAFRAFLTSFNITAPLADKMTAEVGMRVTGPVARV